MSVYDAGKITQKAEALGKTPEEYVIEVVNRKQPPFQVMQAADELGVVPQAVYSWLVKARKKGLTPAKAMKASKAK